MRRSSVLLLFAFTFPLFLASCKSEKEPEQIKLNNITWLVGQWQTEPRERVEVWSKKGDKFQASGIILKGKKPKVNELMNISEENGHLIYSVLAYGQNDNKYVNFSLSNKKANDLIFTNPDHDFPKTIRYTLENEEQLKVTVSDDNEEQSFTFYRSR
jgi:hypothetical protein